MGTILLVDTDIEWQTELKGHLAQSGWRVILSESTRDARDCIDDDDTCPDLIIVDVSSRTEISFELVTHSIARKTSPAVIVTASTEAAETHWPIRALQAGAADFLLKPFTMAQLEDALVRAQTKKQTVDRAPRRTEAHTPIEQWRARHAPGFIGNHEKLLACFDIIDRVADTDCSVLLTGESGTGKELAARAVHNSSPRRSRPFVPVNCGAIPENLIESELFGHARGSFTGATNARTGKFLSADGGTIFLDEIGELPLSMQAKLLRVLQEREITPVGADRSLSVDVRVVAATNRDLDQMVAEGKFREDLLYRINVIVVELPSLRERPTDIPELVHHFIRKCNERRGRNVSGIEPDAMDALCELPWPGNVRQLENTLERMVILRATDELQYEDIPEKLRTVAPKRALAQTREAPIDQPELPGDGIDLRDAVERFENALIKQALERSGWNKNRAATLLQLNRTTLVEKLKKKDLGEGIGASVTSALPPPPKKDDDFMG